jgi:hypothetical protein
MNRLRFTFLIKFVISQMQVWYHFESSLLYHLDIESKSIDITTTDKPLLEIVAAASNRASQ